MQQKTEHSMQNISVELPTTNYSSLPVPGVEEAKYGVCYVKVTDLPSTLDAYMAVNPRVPSRNKAGILSGPVVRGILETLREKPDQMVLKNQGIYLLVQSADYSRGKLHITFNDKGKHGIINGGHTYAAIREAVESATPEELQELQQAFVRLHLFQNIDADFVPEIAEGLNRSKQVDDPSLANLQGEFDILRKALRGTHAEQNIAYQQGDNAPVYVTELLVYLELFNGHRFSDKKHPNALYNRAALGLKYFSEDMDSDRKYMQQLVHKLPEILVLSDKIRANIPKAAAHNRFQFGRAKLSAADERAGAAANKGIRLNFSGDTVNYRVPNGWVYPILAAFRANLSEVSGQLRWKVDVEQVLAATLDDLVSVCVAEHRDNNLRPEHIGKRESAYAQCYTKMQLYLAKRGLL